MRPLAVWRGRSEQPERPPCPTPPAPGSPGRGSPTARLQTSALPQAAGGLPGSGRPGLLVWGAQQSHSCRERVHDRSPVKGGRTRTVGRRGLRANSHCAETRIHAQGVAGGGAGGGAGPFGGPCGAMPPAGSVRPGGQRVHSSGTPRSLGGHTALSSTHTPHTHARITTANTRHPPVTRRHMRVNMTHMCVLAEYG